MERAKIKGIIDQHLGQDFVKDIVAAKSLGMRTVWARELVLDKLKKAQNDLASTEPRRTVEDFVKQVSSQKVVQMSVGAEDYLAESLQEEFADAMIDSFADLADVLVEWHLCVDTTAAGGNAALLGQFG